MNITMNEGKPVKVCNLNAGDVIVVETRDNERLVLMKLVGIIDGYNFVDLSNGNLVALCLTQEVYKKNAELILN